MKTIKESWSLKSFKLKNFWEITLLGCLLLLFSSCATVPKYDQIQGGFWEARSLVKDKKQSKSYLVNIDFFAEKPSSLRADVTTPIGAHVISLAQSDGKVSYVIPRKKQYYLGTASTQVLRELISHPLDISLFTHVLFDIPIEKKGWTCRKTSEGLVEFCENKAQKLKIEWMGRRGVEKVVEIVHPSFEIQLQFHTFKEMSSFKENTFRIEHPKGFKKL